MIDSTLGSVCEVREGSYGLADVVVEPNAGGQREEFGGDPGPEAVRLGCEQGAWQPSTTLRFRT